MAKVTVSEDKRHGTMEEYIHRCGEMIQVGVYSSGIVNYRSAFGSVITQCPHCLRDIEIDDLQLPGMVEQVGWHDE